VLDLDLPSSMGLVVQEELAARSRTRRVPVIIVTGTGWESPVPAFAALRKPVDRADLTPILRKAIIHKRTDPRDKSGPATYDTSGSAAACPRQL
jgi:FixJ family two-component response regulator